MLELNGSQSTHFTQTQQVYSWELWWQILQPYFKQWLQKGEKNQNHEKFIFVAWMLKYVTHFWITLTGKEKHSTNMKFSYNWCSFTIPFFFPLEITYHASEKYISICYIWRKECTLRTLTRNHWSTTISYDIKAGTYPFQ